jgi:hypothetical protein
MFCVSLCGVVFYPAVAGAQSTCTVVPPSSSYRHRADPRTWESPLALLWRGVGAIGRCCPAWIGEVFGALGLRLVYLGPDPWSLPPEEQVPRALVSCRSSLPAPARAASRSQPHAGEPLNPGYKLRGCCHACPRPRLNSNGA